MCNIQTLTLARCWRFSKRTLGQAQIHTGFQRFTEFDLIFHVLLPQSRTYNGAKSNTVQLRILCERQWREQNQAIHRGGLYFQSHAILIRTYKFRGLF